MEAKRTLVPFILAVIILVTVIPTAKATATLLEENQEFTMRCVNDICTLQYDPVCGSDGKTYSNKCRFDCDKPKGVKCLCAGECPCKDGYPKCPSRQ